MNAMIRDWDDAYANGPHIEAAADYPGQWAQAAAGFRDEMAQRQRADFDLPYGDSERQRFDFYRPEGKIEGLVVFIHGGYWRAFDKSSWSHLARGPVNRGWAVAMPSYDLAPTVTIGEITRQIHAFIERASSLANGPIRLSGHSAGGHLVTRMICTDTPLSHEVRQRIDRVVSISGVHDLRPLLKTQMNADFRLDVAQAAAESPALHEPMADVELVCWVGADERPEFVRQSELLANIWTGFGLSTAVYRAPGEHHFNVIDGLADSASPLCEALFA